jgi:hypothetical protein
MQTKADQWAGTDSQGFLRVAGDFKEPSPFDRFHSRWFLHAKTLSNVARPSNKLVTVVTMVIVPVEYRSR